MPRAGGVSPADGRSIRSSPVLRGLSPPRRHLNLFDAVAGMACPLHLQQFVVRRLRERALLMMWWGFRTSHITGVQPACSERVDIALGRRTSGRRTFPTKGCT